MFGGGNNRSQNKQPLKTHLQLAALLISLSSPSQKPLSNYLFSFHITPSTVAKIALAHPPPLPFMGKRLPSPVKIEAYARLASERSKAAKLLKPQSKTLAFPNVIEQDKQNSAPRLATTMEEGRREARMPLSEVVSDCVKRWFQDTLKEARNGDQSMQVLVGQMYKSGYGVARNEQKAKAWITKASKLRPSVWKVSDKRPGYNASDSDSDEVNDDKN